MPKGLHDIGEAKMSVQLQDEIDKVDPSLYSAILLGYGLCNNGVKGLHAKLPLVIPRAHDCITLLLGSKEKYAEYFLKNPGTFFKSTGWVERDKSGSDNQNSITTMLGMNKTYQEYVTLYGEENAKYLMETLGDTMKNYKKLAYIDTHVGDFAEYKNQTRKDAQEKGWEYEELSGDVNLLSRLLNGEWDKKEFLIVEPSCTLKPTYDDEIIDLV
jgi:hypothetical protein